MITIKPMLPEDLPSLRQLYDTIRTEEFIWEGAQTIALSDFEKDTEGEQIYVAWSDEHIAGFVSVWAPDSFIHLLFVDRSFRHLGAASALLAHVREHYPLPLTLKCVQANQQAHRFYLKHGWTVRQPCTDLPVPYDVLELRH